MASVIEATPATKHQRCYGCGVTPKISVEIGHRFVCGSHVSGNSHLIPLCRDCGKKLQAALEGAL